MSVTEALAKVLEFCTDRLVNVHGESPNTDYILEARKAVELAKETQKSKAA